MRYIALAAGLLASSLLVATPAGAYSLHSGLTETCHEQISLRAFLIVSAPLEIDGRVPQPGSKTWKTLAERMTRGLPDSIAHKDNPEFQLLMLSILIGVRSPDTEGHSVSDLNSLRRIHADPSDDGQYAHALRGIGDDGPEGDAAAVAGTRRIIIELLETSRSYVRRPPEEQIINVSMALDFYGPVNVDVWAPAYYLARAMHAMQDSFSHTIRTADHHQIVSVLNYVEAVAGSLKEGRDGIAHSDSLDTCGEDTAPLVEAAQQATMELMQAAIQTYDRDDTALVDAVLDDWVSYAAGCTLANGYCDSPWVSVARKEATGPYLGPLACTASPGGTRGWGVLGVILLLGVARRRWLLLALVCLPLNARAEATAQVEGHLSLLSDAPSRSVLASTYGFGSRVGWRWDGWGLFGHFERNYWVASELSSGTHKGALNLGLGAELLFANGRVRMSYALGASVLRQDTFLHEKGHVGAFAHLRPIGLRWNTAPHVYVTFDPLCAAIVAPVAEEPRILMLQYRSNIAVEYAF